MELSISDYIYVKGMSVCITVYARLYTPPGVWYEGCAVWASVPGQTLLHAHSSVRMLKARSCSYRYMHGQMHPHT